MVRRNFHIENFASWNFDNNHLSYIERFTEFERGSWNLTRSIKQGTASLEG